MINHLSQSIARNQPGDDPCTKKSTWAVHHASCTTAWWRNNVRLTNLHFRRVSLCVTVFCNIIKYRWWYNMEQRCNMILELEMKMSPSNWLLFPALASHLVKLYINLFISEFNDSKRSHELPSSWSEGNRDGKRCVAKVQQLYHQDFLSNSRDLTMWNSRRYCLVLWMP